MLFTFLIPVYNITGYRKRNLEFIYNRLISHFEPNEAEIIFGVQDKYIDLYYSKFNTRAIIKHYPIDNNPNVFNKSFIFNRCIQQGISGEYLIFLDADVYFPYQKLKQQLYNKKYDVIKPFTECVFLNERGTETFLEKKEVSIKENSKRLVELGACCVILHKEILNNISMDENFSDWGWEDIDLANQLSLKYPVHTIEQRAVHLYHEPNVSNNKNYIYFQNKYQYYHKTYNTAYKKDIGIIMSYFSPYGCNRQKENLLTVLDTLKHTKCPITLIEAVLPNSKPIELPDWIDHHVYDINNNSLLFLKQNLYNIGIKNTNHNKLLFLDNDILLDNSKFIDDCSILLDEYDIVQPYGMSVCLDKYNLPLVGYEYRHSFIKNINMLSHRYSSGFVWAITRKFLENVNGLYDFHPLGGSDLAFSYSLHPDIEKENMVQYLLNINQSYVTTNKYQEYVKLVHKFKPKTTYLKNCICRHLYYDAHYLRNYNMDIKYPLNLINNDYPVKYNKDNILEWLDNKYTSICIEYFKNRDMDKWVY